MNKIVYKTSAIAKGGRKGTVKILSNNKELKLDTPKEMGGANNDSFNPEQLFASGYSACFGSATEHVIRISKNEAWKPAKVESVEAEIFLLTNNEQGFNLGANLKVTISGVDINTAKEITAEAHKVCPYSNATRNNINVDLQTVVI